MELVRSMLLQTSLFAGFGNLIGAIVLGLLAKDTVKALPGAILLAALLPWSLGLTFQSIPELRALPILHLLLATFSFIPAAVLHTACVWSGQNGCGKSRLAVWVGYGVATLQALAIWGHPEALGPLVNHVWGTTRMSQGHTFLLHGLFLTTSVLIGGFWCTRAATAPTENPNRRSARTWLILNAVFLPFAITNYLTVYNMPTIALGTVGNCVFLVTLAELTWRWNLFEIPPRSLRLTFYAVFGSAALWILTDGGYFWFSSFVPDVTWAVRHITCSLVVAITLIAYALSVRQPASSRASSSSHGESQAALSTAAPSDSEKLLMNELKDWLRSIGVAVFQRLGSSRSFAMVSSVGMAMRLPKQVSNTMALENYLRQLLRSRGAAQEETNLANASSSTELQPSVILSRFWEGGREADNSGIIVFVDNGANGSQLEKFKRIVELLRRLPLSETQSEVVHSFLPQASRKSRLKLDLGKKFNFRRGNQKQPQFSPEEMRRLKSQFPEIVGEHPKLLRVLQKAERLARCDLPLIIYGETGVGKELLAAAIHRLSKRVGPYLAWNAATIPDALVDASLFGHSRGAFTGADQARDGFFRLCDQGTFFIDEVDSLKPDVQAKLLRAVEGGHIIPLGKDTSDKVNVRIITASHVFLDHLVRAKLFRPDLKQRLEATYLILPPLRERKEDIKLLVEHFVRELLSGPDKDHYPSEVHLTDAAWARLMSYNWPGNIRELKQVIGRCLYKRKCSVVDADDLDLGPMAETSADNFLELLRKAVQAYLKLPRPSLQEACLVLKRVLAEAALSAADGKRSQAARILGMTPSNFVRLLRLLGLDDHSSDA